MAQQLPKTDCEIHSLNDNRDYEDHSVLSLEQSDICFLDEEAVEKYIQMAIQNQPHLSTADESSIRQLLWMEKGDKPTLLSLLLFGLFPQSVYPQLAITAVSVPGTDVGDVSEDGRRFLDSEKLEGTLLEMLDQAIAFCQRNLKNGIRIKDGKRENPLEIPVTALREALLNALIHRDYSRYTLSKPIQLKIFKDRVEIHSPGSLYGNSRVEDLGHTQLETRNTPLVAAMEILKQTENRYSGIPTIRREMKLAGLPEPVFKNERGNFIVIFQRESVEPAVQLDTQEQLLLDYLQTPRSRKEIADFLGYSSTNYVFKTRVKPLIDKGLVGLKFPDDIRNRKQRFFKI